jgi:very-short-patch-repair endonuclease
MVQSTTQNSTSPQTPLRIGEGLKAADGPIGGSAADNKSSEQAARWQTSPHLWDKLKPLARENRHEPTPAEVHLWKYLRNRQVFGYKFRRQHSIDKFIADFYCIEAHLAIEVDGPIHEYTDEEDAIREEFLKSLGIKVLRFANEKVLTSPELVIDQISAFLRKRDSTKTTADSPSPIRRGGQGVR